MPQDEGRTSLQWMVFGRLCALYSLLFILVLQQVFGHNSQLAWSWAYGLLCVSFTFNISMALTLYRIPQVPLLSAVHVLVDAICITTWIFHSGELSVLLYLVQILIVALTLYQRAALLTAITACVSYGIAEWGRANGTFID